MNINATILGQAISFVLFVFFCMKKIWPPIISAIEKRQKEISEGIAFTERAKKDLDLAQETVANQLKEAKKEAQIIIEQANKRRDQILESVKFEAEQERNKIIAQAQVKIENERKRVHEELRKQVAMLIMIGVERVIENSIDEDINVKIVDKLITELQ